MQQDEKGAVKWTNNQDVLNEILNDLTIIKSLCVDGNIHDAYQAALFTYSDISGGLQRTIGDKFDEQHYIKKLNEIGGELEKERNDNFDNGIRMRAFNRARQLIWELYHKMRTDLWASGIIFNIEKSSDPNNAINEGLQD